MSAPKKDSDEADSGRDAKGSDPEQDAGNPTEDSSINSQEKSQKVKTVAIFY